MLSLATFFAVMEQDGGFKQFMAVIICNVPKFTGQIRAAVPHLAIFLMPLHMAVLLQIRGAQGISRFSG